jgi:hypothetical protein
VEERLKEGGKEEIVANISPCYTWRRVSQLAFVWDDEKYISYKTVTKHPYKAAHQTLGTLENTLPTPVSHPLSSPPGGPPSLPKHVFRAAVKLEEEEEEEEEGGRGEKRVGFYVAC